jgi:hypothetical protein
VPFRHSAAIMVAAVLSLPGNYVAKFAHPASGQNPVAGPMLILTRGA